MPAYLDKLINSINDGAKTTQTAAVFLAFVGLYLATTAIATSDEDLLRGGTIELSQLGGVRLPVIVTYLLGPILFLLLHAHLLIRYDMLDTNLHAFRRELQVVVPLEADRQRCRELLPNVEFVLTKLRPQAFVYSIAENLNHFGMPVLVLLAQQISFLRYQSESITLAQQIVLSLDVLLLFWFYRRRKHNNLAQRIDARSTSRITVRRVIVALLFVAPVGISWLYARPYIGESTGFSWLVRKDLWPRGLEEEVWPRWFFSVLQPFDLVTCPELGWGCRYLRLDHRMLIGRVWQERAILQVKHPNSHAQTVNALEGVEGLFLRNRSLRLANFEQSKLYNADLINADLRDANFSFAALTGANLVRANLFNADLVGANLSIATLLRADLSYADLASADFLGADLESADLFGANLNSAQLTGASLVKAKLNAATLGGAELVAADLSGAQLVGAQLIGAELAASNLYGASLRGADLRNAVLSPFFEKSRDDLGAPERVDLGFTDLRGVRSAPIDDEWAQSIRTTIDAIPISLTQRHARQRFERSLRARADLPPFSGFTVSAIALVDNPKDPRWTVLNGREHLTSDVKAYDAALVQFLVAAVRSNEFSMAAMRSNDGGVEVLLNRLFRFWPNQEEPCRTLYPLLARALLTNFSDRLVQRARKRLEQIAAPQPSVTCR